MPAKININSVRQTILADKSGKIKSAAENRANLALAYSFDKIEEDLDSEPITKELEGGAGASNISNTLRGGEPTENLFSFFGFNDGETPIEDLKQLIIDNPPQVEFKQKTKDGFIFGVSINNVKDTIYKNTPLSWGKSWSWVRRIEEGLPGFSNFIARRSSPSESNRSGGGTMAKNKNGKLVEVRSASYIPPKEGYLTKIFNKFLLRWKDAAKINQTRNSAGQFSKRL